MKNFFLFILTMISYHQERYHCEDLVVLSEAKELIARYRNEMREAREGCEILFSIFRFPVVRLLRFARNDILKLRLSSYLFCVEN